MIARSAAMIACSLSAIVLCAPARPCVAQSPVRDRQSNAPSTEGSASVFGVVVDASGTAMRRAIVTIRGERLRDARSAITDDAGAFSFVDLPAGAVTISAERKPFIRSVYGSQRPGDPPLTVTLVRGQRV